MTNDQLYDVLAQALEENNLKLDQERILGLTKSVERIISKETERLLASILVDSMIVSGQVPESKREFLVNFNIAAPETFSTLMDGIRIVEND